MGATTLPGPWEQRSGSVPRRGIQERTNGLILVRILRIPRLHVYTSGYDWRLWVATIDLFEQCVNLLLPLCRRRGDVHGQRLVEWAI